MGRIRTLIADDSLTLRRRLHDALCDDPAFEVVGEASDGAVAIDLCQRLRPDVVTLDMAMPHVTGLDATRHIMQHCPTRILIVSASTNRADLFRTYDALAAGAVDVLEKPTGDEAPGAWDEGLRRAIRIVSRVPVITRLLTPRPATSPVAPVVTARSMPRRARVVAIGASTGGPAAVVSVLRALPAPAPVPVLIVLHVARGFGGALAAWLDQQSAHRVVVARSDMRLEPGPVILAPPDVHLVVERARVALSGAPERHSCRPSVDVLFESLAEWIGSGTVASLLTGMGKDGAAGLLAIRNAGGVTIAQDEATSVVYGMPREAREIGAAQHVLPLDAIGRVLADAVAATRPEGVA